MRQQDFSILLVWQLFYICYKGKIPLSSNLYIFYCYIVKKGWAFKVAYILTGCLKLNVYFQGVLRRSHGWSLIKLENVRLNELSQVVVNQLKKIKWSISLLFSFFNSFSMEHRMWLLLKYNNLNIKFLTFQNKILGKWDPVSQC